MIEQMMVEGYYCPMVWKKGKVYGTYKRVLIKLALMPYSRVVIGNQHGIGSGVVKCRVNKALVVGFYSMRGKKLSNDLKVSSLQQCSPPFFYVVGEVVKPRKKFTTDPVSCASGIHFFFSKNAARMW